MIIEYLQNMHFSWTRGKISFHRDLVLLHLDISSSVANDARMIPRTQSPTSLLLQSVDL